VPDFSKLQAETRRERIRQRKDDCDNRYDGEISSGPHLAQSFAESEDAKGDDDDAHTKLEGVFRYLDERTMEGYPECGHYDSGCDRSQSSRKRRRGIPNSDHNQYYLYSLDDHRLERRGQRQEGPAFRVPINPSFAGPPAHVHLRWPTDPN
jgi:hypothetical protein